MAALCDRAGLEAGVRALARDLFGRLTAGALERPATPPYEGLSRINGNGLPFQWSFQLDNDAPGIRFLCEAGRPGASSRERYLFSLERLREACQLIGCSALPTLEVLLDRQLLPGEAEWPSHWQSALWFAVGIDQRGAGIKAYFNLNRGTPEQRWRRIGQVLAGLGRRSALRSLCDLSGEVSRGSWPVGIAFDLLSGDRIGRVKCYFRSEPCAADWLVRWYGACGMAAEAERVRRLLDAFPLVDCRRYPERAFHLSLELYSGDHPTTLKIDLDIGRWLKEDDAITALRVGSLCRELGIDSSSYLDNLDALGLDPARRSQTRLHRFVGLGLEEGGGCHINTYLEPLATIPATREPVRPAPLSWSPVMAGLEYLMGAVAGDHWQDFRLPVGESDQWATAFMLYQLDPRILPRKTPFRDSGRRAAQWLWACRDPEQGWGYNASTPRDADSTSFAVLALRRWLPQVAAEIDASRWLAPYLRSDGGFSTYRPGTKPGAAWNESCVEVTPLAYLARGLAVEPLVPFLRERRRSDGLWDSYWWTSPLYATWAVLEVGSRDPALTVAGTIGSLSEAEPATCFERALLILCLIRLEEHRLAQFHASVLAAGQQLDGGWPSSAVLRLTQHQTAAPCRSIDSGSLFIDGNRCFSTATAIAALASVIRSS